MIQFNNSARERLSTQVLALVRQERDLKRLRAAFGDTCAFVQSVKELSERQSFGEVVLAFAAVDAADVSSLCHATKNLVRQSICVSLLASLTEPDLRAVMECSRAGASSIIVRDLDDNVHGLRRLLDVSLFIQMPAQILQSLDDELREPARSLVADCLAHSHQRERAHEVSLRMGICERTATNWARSGGFRGVREVLSLTRLVVAIGFLESTPLSVSEVADRLNFGSASHLANTIRRYTGHPLRSALKVGDRSFWARRLLVGGNSATSARIIHG